MKTVIIILSMSLLSLGVSAQRKGGFYHSYAPRVVVVPSVNYGIGLGFGYPFFGYPFFGYPFYGYPFGYNPYYGNARTPYNLSLEIQSIKISYTNKIRNARKDKSISHAQRRQEIRNLKAERDQAIIDAQRNYRTNRMNYNQNRGNNNQNPGNNNNNNNNQNPGAGDMGQNNANTSAG